MPAPGEPPRVVEIKLYGMHRTGWYDTPYYAVWVWGSPTPVGYTPAIADYRIGPPGLELQRLAAGVYEAWYP